MTQIDYRIIDADNHYYEPEDCYTRYIAPAMRDAAIRLVEDAGGRRVLVGDRPFTFLEDPFRQTAVRPGALRDMLRNLSSRQAGAADSNGLVEPIRAEYVDKRPVSRPWMTNRSRRA